MGQQTNLGYETDYLLAHILPDLFFPIILQ